MRNPLFSSFQKMQFWENHSLILRGFALIALMGLGSIPNLQACTITVNNQVNSSVNTNCVAQVPVDILYTTNNCSGPTAIEVYKNSILVASGVDLQTLVLDGDNGAYEVLGTYTFVIIDLASNNSQNGLLLITDTHAPTLQCQDLEITCFEDVDQAIEDHLSTLVADNCEAVNLNLVQILPDLLPDCANNRLKSLRRVYQAVDASGNASPLCTITVHIQRAQFLLQDVDFPAAQVLSCNAGFATDFQGNPHPSVTGTPSYNGQDLYTSFLPCNITATYVDTRVNGCGSSATITRTWTVTEMCPGGSPTVNFENQVIEILSDQDPFFTNCPSQTLVLSSGFFSCSATLAARSLGIEATVEPGCSEITHIAVLVNGFPAISNLLDPTESDLLILPGGDNTVEYVAFDACLNTATCTFTITVEDQVTPVAACTQQTVVTLNNLGLGTLYAVNLDNGSWDNCGIASFTARRMDGGPCNLSTTFTESVDFCCGDAGTVVPVIVRITDTTGNFNDCMVQVTVQDQTGPVITAPTSITVDCNTFFDPSDLSLFGKVVLNDASLIENIQIGGEILGIDGIAIDICGATITESILQNTLNECGVGIIERQFTATDPDGNTASANQVITFVITDPFTENDIVWPPAEVMIVACGADVDPSITGSPQLLNLDKCTLPGVTFSDMVFQSVDDACFKIIRTWTVMDWCQSNGTFEEWPFDQTIKVFDNVAPVFEPVEDVSVCSFNTECEQEMIDLTAIASDDCTPNDELVYTWFVNANYDPADLDPAIFAQGQGNDASGVYPVGTHRVVFLANDKCGNSSSTQYLFTVANCKQPNPICQELIAALSTDTSSGDPIGTVSVNASDFDAASYSDCGGDLVFSFSPNVNDTLRIFDCEDLGEMDLNIWVTDIFGNQNFCETTITIQDNDNICPDDRPEGLIAGKITDENGESVEAIHLNLFTDNSVGYTITNDQGQFTFENVKFGDHYTLYPEKNDDLLNGITTLDIVIIQRHLLGNQTLDNPYKMIAADVNRDGRVNSLDILHLRQVVLQQRESFENNQSWRFIDANFDLESLIDPLEADLPHTLHFNGLDADVDEANFVAIKVGDVNNSSLKKNLEGWEERNQQSTALSAEEVHFTKGDKIKFALYSDQLEWITALQFTLEFDLSRLAFQGINPGSIAFNENNLHVFSQGSDLITASWGSTSPVKVDNKRALFTFVFEALEDGILSDNLFFTSNATKALAYDGKDQAYHLGVDWRAQTAAEASFQLYQNTPNPFHEETLVRFTLEETEVASFTIYDLAGKIVHTQIQTFPQGENQILITKNQLGGAGVYYYELKSAKKSSTKKMILIQ
jgi:hypothetical protein